MIILKNKVIKSCYGACDDCGEYETCDDAPKMKETKQKIKTDLLEYEHEIPPWKK